MWRKFTSALKHGNDEQESTSSQGEVISKVLEQHPNLSMFQTGPQDSALAPPSPPSSPSKHSRRLFKRGSRVPPPRDDEPTGRAPSPGPSKLGIGIPKKVKSSLSLAGNNSQLSLGRASGKNMLSPDTGRRPSLDLLNSPYSDAGRGPSLDLLRTPSSPNAQFDSVRSSPPDFQQRPSIDTLQGGAIDLDGYSPLTPNGAPQGSVRSILREPNTPGTGRNVRFFSREAYSAVSADQSTDNEYQPITSPVHVDAPQRNATFSGVVFRPSSSPKNARPSVAEVFSPLRQDAVEKKEAPSATNNTDSTNLLNLSQDIQLPGIPPGLGFDLDLDSAIQLPLSDDDNAMENGGGVMTSTPYRSSVKGKGKEREDAVSAVTTSLDAVDEAVFHSKEKSPRLPSMLHDRSHSFSFGQTAFFSMGDTSNRSSSSSAVPSLTSADTKSSPSPASLRSSMDSPSQSSIRNRSRALSDTVFHSILRSSPAIPEADINDESSSELVVYAPGKPEPDPFSATANTYYTPQTMIPVTPPRNVLSHARKTSREDSVIVSLQTQLALQTELCSQYETDLRARDELVDILGKKVADLESEETKRKGVLRAWKKKVAELQRTCRYLEDEVEGSRQESMERSVMDEASGEALRMLHRQIASLEREKGDMSRREEVLREELQTLEGLVRERSEDVMNLKQTIWSRDENQRELQKGIKEAQEQIEQMGNLSIALMDEDELKRYMAESEQKNEEEKERHRVAEADWETQRAEMILTTEKAKADTVALEGEVESLRQQLKDHDDELTTLKNELEAQWGHAEKATEKIEALEEEKRGIDKERQALNGDVEELQERLAIAEGRRDDLEEERQSLNDSIEQLEERIGNMDAEWEESENRKAELEREKDALEEEKQQLLEINEDLQQQVQSAKDQIRYKHEHAERLAQTAKENETRIAELEMEHGYTANDLSRLQTNIQQRDEEISELSGRVVEQQKEIESLRETISNVRREHTRVVEEQQRELQRAAEHEGETTEQLTDLLKRQGEQNVELRTNKEKVTNLKEEVERLRRQVHTLQQESADKEVKIVQMTKQRDHDKEDLVGLNLALDSKQQELELLKRRHGVRGTAGSTSSTPAPAPTRVGAQRRDSSVFSTPSHSRPSSVLSDSGKESTVTKEKRGSTDISTKLTNALAKSTRANGSISTGTGTGTMGPPSTTKPRVNGTMGPPPRASAGMGMGTPTPATRVSSLSRSSSARPTATASSTSSSSSTGTGTAAHRRTSSVLLDHSQAKGLRGSVSGAGMKLLPSTPTAKPNSVSGSGDISEEEEKENRDTSTSSSAKTDRRRSMIPMPAGA